MVDGEPHTGGVVDRNAIGGLVPAADDDERHTLRAELVGDLPLAARLQHHDPGRAVLEQRLDPRALARRMAVGVAHHGRVPGDSETLLDELRKF